ncbi:hypothetical protein ACWGRF_04245 [Streptomyces zhihengii]
MTSNHKKLMWIGLGVMLGVICGFISGIFVYAALDATALASLLVGGGTNAFVTGLWTSVVSIIRFKDDDDDPTPPAVSQQGAPVP